MWVCYKQIVVCKVFYLVFHLSSFTHRNVTKNICRMSTLHFQVSKVESCVLKLWFHFLNNENFHFDPICIQFLFNWILIQLN